MGEKYKAIEYGNYIMRVILVIAFSLLVPVIYLLTRESGERFQWGYIFYPLICGVLLVLFLHVARKITLGTLLTMELDAATVYKLDKRSAKHEIHNLILLINVCFFEGNFQQAIFYCDRVLQLSNKPKEIFDVVHIKILCLFYLEQTQEIFSLIRQQREWAKTHRLVVSRRDLYYSFFEKYLTSQYEEACEIIKRVLSIRNIEIQYSQRVIVFSLMRNTFLKLDKLDDANHCAQQILLADPHHRTIFSKLN